MHFSGALGCVGTIDSQLYSTLYCECFENCAGVANKDWNDLNMMRGEDHLQVVPKSLMLFMTFFQLVGWPGIFAVFELNKDRCRGLSFCNNDCVWSVLQTAGCAASASSPLSILSIIPGSVLRGRMGASSSSHLSAEPRSAITRLPTILPLEIAFRMILPV